MSNSKSVLVVGTGTIGEPLIGLLCRLKSQLGLDEIIFHKRTPLRDEIAKVDSLISMGAKLAVDDDPDRLSKFAEMGHEVSYTWDQAIKKASVVVDCTPAGNKNKENHYKKHGKDKLFIAQGSEKGFGTPYALGLTDQKVIDAKDNFVQVVSCNTHAIARIISAVSERDPRDIMSGDFTCIRRANDVSQDTGFSPSTSAGKHSDEKFGTHHARDVNDLYSFPIDLPIFSSALKTNTQYMHTVRFSITLPEAIDRAEIVNRFQEDEFVCMTQKTSANKIFSFGRDHGFYGRIYSQTVVCEPSLAVFHPTPSTTRVVGVAFTPQDGNSLMSSVAMCLYGTHGKKALHGSKLVACLKQMMLQDV